MKSLCAVFFLVIFLCVSSAAQTTAFTFQGSLKDGASAANGSYDFEFKLFDLVSGGAQQGSTLQRLNVAVANGIFTVSLDFGAAVLPGADRFLEIGLRVNGNPGGFQQLLPRQQIASSPYSIKSLAADNATNATNAAQLGGVAASQYVVTTDPRMTDSRSPTAGSANYIQNATSPQASSNFNISGNGTAGGTLRGDIVRADTSYNIGINPFISIAGINNTFVGVLNGDANTTGTDNSFFGRSAGTQNSTGSFNTFVGTSSGFTNSTGSRNTFVGRNSGLSNNASDNSFFGYLAGSANTVGTNNSFFGANTGNSNTNGGNNSFFGSHAGDANTAGNNSFFGAFSGNSTTIGSDNSFFGSGSGSSNTTGDLNAFFGRRAGRANTTGDSNSFFGWQSGDATTTGTDNSFFGAASGRDNIDGIKNSFFGNSAGIFNSTGSSNVFLGDLAGTTNTTGSNNTILGSNANVATANLSYATAIGADSSVSTSNTIALGRVDGSDAVRVNGLLRIGVLGAATATNLCRLFNVLTGLYTVSDCSSSIRYKENVVGLKLGLDTVGRLRPVTFDWKDSRQTDLGLIAEEVESIDPLLVTYNQDNQIQGVKYDQLTVVLINAVKEQQEQIEKQQALIESQQRQNDELRKQVEGLRVVVCSIKADAEICNVKEK